MGLTDKTTVAAYTMAIGTAAGGLTVNELVALGGLGLAIATFILNAVYKHLHYKLQKAAHDAEK